MLASSLGSWDHLSGKTLLGLVRGKEGGRQERKRKGECGLLWGCTGPLKERDGLLV